MTTVSATAHRGVYEPDGTGAWQQGFVTSANVHVIEEPVTMNTAQRAHCLSSEVPANRGPIAPMADSTVTSPWLSGLATALTIALAAALAGCGGGEAGSDIVGGVKLESVVPQFVPGKVTITDNPLDLAIRGAGFFQISNDNSPPMYSRNGHFMLDIDGYIANNTRMRLMGHQANVAGAIQSTGRAVALKPNMLVPPRATDYVTIALNLDSREAATGKAAAPGIDFTDATTYNRALALSVYDVRGQDVVLALYFQKSDVPGPTPGSIVWNVFATANGLPVGGEPAAPVTTLVYAANGSTLIGPGGKVTLADIVAADYATGAINVPLTNVVLNLEGSTQFASGFTITDVKQTGSTLGRLTSLNFESNGVVMGGYSNGRTVLIGQVELVTFRNLQCLQAVGNSAWIATDACGEPLAGTPGSGKFGVLQSSALEEP